MKNIYFIRNGESSWSDSSDMDFERILTAKGLKEVEDLAKYIDIKPDAILSSCAMRTQDTSIALAKALGYSKKVHYFKELYFGTIDNTREILAAQSDISQNIFVIGHDAHLRRIIFMLTKEYLSKLPTASITKVSIDIKRWEELSLEMNIVGTVEAPQSASMTSDTKPANVAIAS